MDLLICMVGMAILGFIRAKATDAIPEMSIETSNSSGETVLCDVSKYPIGTNLEGRYEVGAYTAILKELGLIQ